jgi:hypothetical protein
MPRLITGINHVCLGLDRPIGVIAIPCFAVVIHDEQRATTLDDLVVGYALHQHETPCFKISLSVNYELPIELDDTINKFGRCELIIDGDPNVDLGCLDRNCLPKITPITKEDLSAALREAQERHLRAMIAAGTKPEAASATTPGYIPGIGH